MVRIVIRRIRIMRTDIRIISELALVITVATIRIAVMDMATRIAAGMVMAATAIAAATRAVMDIEAVDIMLLADGVLVALEEAVGLVVAAEPEAAGDGAKALSLFRNDTQSFHFAVEVATFKT